MESKPASPLDALNRQDNDAVLFEQPNQRALAEQDAAATKAEADARAAREAADPVLYSKARTRLEALEAKDSGDAEADSRAQKRLNRYLQSIHEAEDRIAAGTPEGSDEAFVTAYHDVFDPYLDQQEAKYDEAEAAAKLADMLDEPAPFTDEDRRRWQELKANPMRDASDQFDFVHLDRHFAPLEEAAQQAAVATALEMNRLGNQMATTPESDWNQDDLARTREYNRQINEILNLQSKGEALTDDQKRQLDVWNKVRSGEIKAETPTPTPEPEAPATVEAATPPAEAPETLSPEEEAGAEEVAQMNRDRDAAYANLPEEPAAPEALTPEEEAGAEEVAQMNRDRDAAYANLPEEPAAPVEAPAAEPAEPAEPEPIAVPLAAEPAAPEAAPATPAETPAAPEPAEPAPGVGLAENLRNRARGLVNHLRERAGHYRENPSQIIRDTGRLLRDGVVAWWNGVMPVEFYEGKTATQLIKDKEFNLSYLKNWKWMNMAFYTAGVAGGTLIDIVSIFPGAGALRPAVRAALGVAAPIAMGRSEAARRARIIDSDLPEDEKAALLIETQEKHSRASGYVKNLAHGVAAGMVASTLVQALGIDKGIANLFKGNEPGTMGARPLEGLTEAAETPAAPVETDIVFKAVEGRGFWGADVSALGDAANNWEMAAGTGSNKTEILGWLLRQNADRFGAAGDTIALSDLGENSKKVIDLLRTSPTWQSFVDAGGRDLINQINAGAK